MTECPNCGSENEPEIVPRGIPTTESIVYYNCVDCDFSTWDKEEFNPRKLMFSYGMNFNPSNMPGFRPVGAALLRGWKWVPRHCANIEQDGSSVVYGAVWAVTASEERRMDAREGYREGREEFNHYNKKEIEVEMQDGSTEKAFVYVMSPFAFRGNVLTTDCYSPWYVRDVLAGFRYFGIDEEYLPDEVKIWRDRDEYIQSF